MKNIFIINGGGGKGKDTFIKFCEEFVYVRNESSIDPAKRALSELCEYKIGDEKEAGEVGEKWRKALSDLKRVSIEIDDYPFKYITKKVKEFYESKDDVLFIHIREADEIKRVQEHFDCLSVLVRNNQRPDITSNGADANVEEYVYDIIVNNDGTLDDLREMAFKFCKAFIK